MLTKYDLLPYPKHSFCKRGKGSILYIGGNKPGSCPKGWRGKLVQLLHHKSGGETDGANNVIFFRRMEEEWNPIELNNWTYKTISG